MRRSIDDLAIFGAPPAFAEPLHVGRPNIGSREHLLERINDLLDRHCLTNNGPYVREFERRIAEVVGVRHCIATCNGTVALEIAIRALKLSGEVIVPSMTFIATAHALRWQEIAPVFCDVNLQTYTIDPARVEEMITSRTTGIIGVHLWGRACDVDALTDIARRHKVALLFDAAHAFACSYKGQMIGGFGDAEVFSFHATKFLNTFEGGAVVTNNSELAAKIRLMKNFGFAGYDNVISIGTNGKMSEVCGAMGLTSLESLEDFVGINYRNHKQYQEELSDISGVHILTYDAAEKCNYHCIIVEIDEEVAGVSRDQVVEILHAENVLARRYFYPGCHRMEPYRSDLPHAALLLPNTERLAQRVISLPAGTAMREADISEICALIRFTVHNAVEVRARQEGRASAQCRVYRHPHRKGQDRPSPIWVGRSSAI